MVRTGIVRTPGIVGGRPRLEGTRMPVSAIAVLSRDEGFDAGTIIAKVFPHLTFEQVSCALAYYSNHREEIDKEIDVLAREFDRQVAEAGR